jgi:hypothetical protein
VVLLVMNDDGMPHLLSDKFTIGGEATACSGPVGSTNREILTGDFKTHRAIHRGAGHEPLQGAEQRIYLARGKLCWANANLSVDAGGRGGLRAAFR